MTRWLEFMSCVLDSKNILKATIAVLAAQDSGRGHAACSELSQQPARVEYQNMGCNGEKVLPKCSPDAIIAASTNVQ